MDHLGGDLQPPPTRLRQRMLSDEAAWLQGIFPRRPTSSACETLPKIPLRSGSPDLCVVEREWAAGVGHAAPRERGHGLSERRGAKPLSSLAIPSNAAFPSRSQTSVPGVRAAGFPFPQRPHTTAATWVSPTTLAAEAELDFFSPHSHSSQERLPSVEEPRRHSSDYFPPPSREAPSPGDSPSEQLFHRLYANHGLPTVCSQSNSPVYGSFQPNGAMGLWEGVEEQAVGAAVKSLAQAEPRELGWQGPKAGSPVEKADSPSRLDSTDFAAQSKYHLLAELHAEEKKTAGPPQRLNSAPWIPTQRASFDKAGSIRRVLSRGQSRAIPIEAVPPEQSKHHGDADSPTEAHNKLRGKEGCSESADWHEQLSEHQQRIAQARAQGKIVRKLSPSVEAARVAAERMRQEKKEQEKAAILEAQQLWKNSVKDPRPRVAHMLDPDLESAWEKKKRERDNTRKQFCKKTTNESQNFATRLADVKSKVADLREFTPEEKAQRAELFAKREAAKRLAEMKLKSDNEEFVKTISETKPRTQARLTEEDLKTREQAKQNFANGKYHQQELKLQYDVAIELRRKMFRGEFQVSKETQKKIYLKGRDAAVASMKMAGRAK